MNINGWDTICTVETSYINQQLKQNMGSLIQSFDFSGNDPLGGGDYQIQGEFAAWQIVPGGANQLIHMQVPIASGSVIPASGTPIDISGMSVVVEVSLQLLPSSVDQSVKELRFNFQQAGTQPGDTTPGLVTPVAVSDPNNTGKGGYVESAIVQCLVAHGDEVSFVFANIGVVKASADTWLKPALSAYSYQAPTGSDSSYLVILSVTQDRDITQLDTQIDSGLISTSYPVTFAISSELFLKNVVMPMLPSVFAKTDASTFQYVEGTGITNTHGFPTPGVTKGAITYHPNVDALTLTSSDNYLQTSLKGSCGLDVPNASMDFSIQTKNVLVYDAQGNTLSFQKDSDPQTSHTNHIPWYDYALLALSGGIGLAVFAIVVPLVASETADQLNSNSSGINLAQSPPQTIQWQGMQRIQVRDAGLDDLFYLRGDVVPAQAT